jgi:hypothetical protein
MQVFNGVTSRDRKWVSIDSSLEQVLTFSATLDTSWITCVNEACDKKYAAQNIYQGMYIAEVRPP